MVGRTAAALIAALAAGCAPEPGTPETEIRVRVGTVALDHQNAPVVILEEEGGPRILPIWVGSAEATSIAAQLNHQEAPRPNSHDMAKRVIQQLDARLERVVVTKLEAGTYFAILHLRAGGRAVEIDVRPSDGIAVALRMQAPILVRASVFDQAGELVEGEDGRSIGWAAPSAAVPATPVVNL
jgi:bifunctional DNase/RNase